MLTLATSSLFQFELLSVMFHSDFDSQIKEKLDKVVAKQRELSEKWDKHWEVLQQCECTNTNLCGAHKDTNKKY